MTKDQIYEIWRPAASPWSRWVKPVLFSFLREQDLKAANYRVPDWRVPLVTDAAIIADLPGADGVSVGTALCRAGYRPLPVYNACPYATYDPDSGATFAICRTQPLAAPVLVDVLPIMSALCGTAEELALANLPASAPPVFLLDSNRRGPTAAPDPGWFDNRTFVTVADFPSADFFKEYGVSKIVLVQTESRIQADLLQVLLALQRDGMTIARQTPWEPWEPRSTTVKRPPIIVYAWEWLRRAFGYRRNSFGSFGELVRPSSS